jgi:hypothetical protein
MKKRDRRPARCGGTQGADREDTNAPVKIFQASKLLCCHRFDSKKRRRSMGPDLFRAACVVGLEGLVSKRSDRPYRGGRSPHWIKVKNRAHHVFDRVKNSFS